MRKIILNVAVSLDGYIEGPNGEYDWCFADQDYGMTEFFEQIDLIFMGRKSYTLISERGDINAFPQDKYIFSDTLVPKDHPGVEIVRAENFAEQVRAIKQQPGGHIWLFGGADLTASFLNEGLIDEYLLSIHPVVLGSGKALFNTPNQRVNLQHIDTRTYSTGLIQARYIAIPKSDRMS